MNLLAVEASRMGLDTILVIGVAVFFVLGLIIKKKLIRTILFILAGLFIALMLAKVLGILPVTFWQAIRRFLLIKFGIPV